MRRLLVGMLAATIFIPSGVACRKPQRTPLPAAQLKGLFYVAWAYTEPADGRTAAVLKGSAGTPETLYVANEEVLTLAQVRNVRYSVNADGRGALVFLLTDDGRNKLAAASRAHVGQRLAMFVKGELHSAPVVKEPLANGEFELWGAVYSDDQLRDLGHTLRTGLGYSP